MLRGTRATLLPTFLAISVVATPVAAQICNGMPSLRSSSPANVAASAAFPQNAMTYGVAATFGAALHGRGGLSYTAFDDVGPTDGALKLLSLGVGYELPSEESGLSFCPSAEAGYGFGLQFGPTNITMLTIAPALAVGFEAPVSSNLSFVPFAQLALIHTRMRADGSTTESNSDGLVLLGAGFILEQRWTFSPSVTIPIASDAEDVVFGVGLALALGS